MKRFIRYIYEYRNGKRVQNVGFVKVEESADSAVIQIYGKGFPAADNQELEILLFYLEDGKCIGIPKGTMQSIKPMVYHQVELPRQDHDIAGIALKLHGSNDDRCYAATWEEQEIDVEQMVVQEPVVQQMVTTEVETKEMTETVESPGSTVYKITRKDLVNLPRQEWKLANNHFLVHGCKNYHHLVSFEKDGACWLGVPGIYHKQEAQVARAFGFGQFMKPEEGEVQLDEEEMTEDEEFGYWCRTVHHVIKG